MKHYSLQELNEIFGGEWDYRSWGSSFMNWQMNIAFDNMEISYHLNSYGNPMFVLSKQTIYGTVRIQILEDEVKKLIKEHVKLAVFK